MNEKEKVVLDMVKGRMWPVDAEVFARWYAKGGESVWGGRVMEWADRFSNGSALSKMDLRNLRLYKEAVVEVLEERAG